MNLLLSLLSIVSAIHDLEHGEHEIETFEVFPGGNEHTFTKSIVSICIL